MISQHSSFSKIPFTQEAYSEMEANLARYKAQEQELIPRLQVAREMGDLSENGAYKYAKFELGRVRREIRHLEYLLARGEVKTGRNSGKVEFGSRVEVEVQGQRRVFQIVSEHEANPLEGKISYKSPLGSALMHSRTGDVKKVSLPNAEVLYTVVSIK